ncbi:MAG: phosphoribosyl-AMP cyclohydrolase [Euryarchaeota archaeon]|nr:phosphoribosyl-AMP cyclohydrolase [Euryarchaeota archaeon]
MELLEKANFRIKIGGEDLAIGIAQDHLNKEVLMVAFVNREALAKTIETGKVHYYSTSRKKVWLKGEESGHQQTVKDIFLDCDGDAILFQVEQVKAACHEGYRSCFYRRAVGDGLRVVGERIFDPKEVYK